jgi:hypothetical protein
MDSKTKEILTKVFLPWQSLVYDYKNKKDKEKEKFASSSGADLGKLLIIAQLGVPFFAALIFFNCRKSGYGGGFLEFLACCCCSPFYIAYRFIYTCDGRNPLNIITRNNTNTKTNNTTNTTTTTKLNNTFNNSKR